jgi:arylformamidase
MTRMLRPLTVTLALGLFNVGTAAAQTAPPAPAVTSQPASRPARTPLDQSPVVAPGSRIVWDVPYVPDGDELQKLDIYAPRDAKGAPVVIFVHGGEWARHDKAQVSFKPKFLNGEGVVFVSVNYRLSPAARHPAQVDDVAAAVRWLREHVAEYGGDPHKLVLMGHSAGCHIVTLVGLDPRYLAKVGLAPTDLAGVVSWSGGAFDLVAKVNEGGMYAGYIRQNFGEEEAAWRDASPMRHVTDAKALPRFLFASAEEDKPASKAASQEMVQLIQAAGSTARTVLLPGKNHSTANHELGQLGDETGSVLVGFVREATGARQE